MLLHWALSTMVISQKAPVVEHCEQVGRYVFLPVSSIDATQKNLFPLHCTEKFSQRRYKGIFMM